MQRFYQFVHGAQITVTIPAGVTAWKDSQREGLTMTVCHPQRRVYTILGDYELIKAEWFDGSTIHNVRVRVEWILERERFRQPESREDGEQVTVQFPAGVIGDRMSVYQWVIAIKRDPNEWTVYRNGVLLEYWTGSVKPGETVTLVSINKK